MLSAVTANPACLSKADSSHSASLTGMMLHDRAASTSMWSVPGCYIASKIKLFVVFFPLMITQEDYAGYDFENRLHVRIHSALASMKADVQP